VEAKGSGLLMRFSHESVIKNGLNDSRLSLILAMLPKPN
jgi:hypothetical protein